MNTFFNKRFGLMLIAALTAVSAGACPIDKNENNLIVNTSNRTIDITVTCTGGHSETFTIPGGYNKYKLQAVSFKSIKDITVNGKRFDTCQVSDQALSNGQENGRLLTKTPLRGGLRNFHIIRYAETANGQGKLICSGNSALSENSDAMAMAPQEENVPAIKARAMEAARAHMRNAKMAKMQSKGQKLEAGQIAARRRAKQACRANIRKQKGTSGDVIIAETDEDIDLN